jgi:hypothetical protein
MITYERIEYTLSYIKKNKDLFILISIFVYSKLNVKTRGLLLLEFSGLKKVRGHKALEHGILGFIQKPFSRDEIIEKIELILDPFQRG